MIRGLAVVGKGMSELSNAPWKGRLCFAKATLQMGGRERQAGNKSVTDMTGGIRCDSGKPG